jgi:DNA-binding IclR family transcriptional regulator
VRSAERDGPTGERDTGIRRGLDILGCLAGDEAIAQGGLGVSRLAQLLDQDKSQISRSLKVLAEYGVIERDPKTRAFRLGWKLYVLAQRSADQRLLEKAGPILDELLASLDESVYLSVTNGYNALTVLQRQPSHAVQATVGDFPLHSTSVGRTLLAGRSESELRAMYMGVDVRTQGPEGLAGIDALIERIAQARAAGYSVVIDEFEKGLTAVGAPVFDPKGEVVAAIGVSGPSFRFALVVSAAATEVVAAARRLTSALRESGMATQA